MVDGFSPSGCMFSSTRDYTLTSKPLALYPRPPQTCQGGGVQAIADGRDVRCQRCRAFPRPASAFAKLWRRVGNSRCSATHWCLLTPWSTAFGTPLPRRRSRAPREGHVECTGFCLTILPIMLISFSSMIMRPSVPIYASSCRRGASLLGGEHVAKSQEILSRPRIRRRAITQSLGCGIGDISSEVCEA
jgi:hypothetical protein